MFGDCRSFLASPYALIAWYAWSSEKMNTIFGWRGAAAWAAVAARRNASNNFIRKAVRCLVRPTREAELSRKPGSQESVARNSWLHGFLLQARFPKLSASWAH